MRILNALSVCTSILLVAGTALLGGCASHPRLVAEVENAALSGDGVSIRFLTAGRDKPEPTIVLVHGFGGDASIWEEQIHHLAMDHRVVALDLPGHGKSGSDRMGDWTMQAFGDDVRAVCEEMGAARVILVGHSMGCPAVIEAARLMPDRVVSLVLVEPPHHDVEGKMSEDVIKQVLADWKADYKGNVERMAHERLFIPTSDEKIVQSVVQRMLTVQPFIARAMIASLFRYDFARAMEEVHVPMHFINSSALGPTDVAALERHSKHVDLQVIDGVGHFPMLEAPAKFDAALDAAIAGQVMPLKGVE